MSELLHTLPESFEIDDLHLGWVCHPALLGEYLEFARERSNPEGLPDYKKGEPLYSTGAERILDVAQAMVRPESGFLWDKWDYYGAMPEFERMLPTVLKDRYGRETELTTLESRWKYFCEQLHRELTSLERRIKRSGEYGQTRKVEDRIPGILEAVSPWATLYEMEVAMWAQPIPGSWGLRRALEVCRRLMVSFLIRYPFRAETFFEMRRLDIQDDGTHMILTLIPTQFKTHRFLAGQKYVIVLDPALYPHIRHYLTDCWPMLAKNCPIPYLFFHSRRYQPETREKMFAENLGNAVEFFSQHYLGHLCEAGFRTHAVRHIIATDIILRDHINGWREAAIALWESEKQIRLTYAHLGNKRFLRKHAERVAQMSQLENPFAQVLQSIQDRARILPVGSL